MAELAEDRRPPSLGRQVTDLADRQPKAPAVTCGPDTLDWRGLDRRSNQLARAFADLGVAVGSFVTIAMPNSIDFVVACVAAWKLGATPQPVSSRLPQAELQGIVELADPPVVIGTGARYDTARAWLPAGFRPPAETDDGPLPDVVAPSWKAPTSGGSTGRPKLIVSGQPGTYDPIAARFWRCEAPATLLMPGPMYHNGPFCSALPGMMTGAHLVLMERFDPIETLRLVAEHRVTWLYLVPTMMSRIWQLPPEMRDQHDLSSLETVWHLAAPCPAWLKEAWIDWLGAECIWELYGGTEGIATTVISGQEWLAHRGSVGRPVAGEIRILAEDGTEAAPGEIGEVYLRRSPGSPPTYRYIGASARRQGDWESLLSLIHI